MDKPILWIDTETTGTDPETGELIQIAAIAERDGKVQDSIELKLEFDEKAASVEALAVNHYDAEVWAKEAIPQKDALESLSRFMEPYKCINRTSNRGYEYKIARVAGHNARFDCQFIMAAGKRHKVFIPADLFMPLDTLQLALWKLHDHKPGPENFKLGTLCEYLKLDVPDGLELHDAMTDIVMTRLLAEALTGLRG